MPHLAARGWVQATMPLVLWTTLLLLLNLAHMGRPSGKRSFVGRGIFDRISYGQSSSRRAGRFYKAKLWVSNGNAIAYIYMFSTASLAGSISARRV